MKNIFLVLLLLSFNLLASEEEISFWDNVKNSSDIELLQLYKKKYPNGTFESLADIKIKRLRKANKTQNNLSLPKWLKGETTQYKYYGVGKANKHFKGKDYQESLAYKRAERKLVEKLNSLNLKKSYQQELLTEVQREVYIDKKERIYLLLYIDNNNQ